MGWGGGSRQRPVRPQLQGAGAGGPSDEATLADSVTDPSHDHPSRGSPSSGPQPLCEAMNVSCSQASGFGVICYTEVGN